MIEIDRSFDTTFMVGHNSSMSNVFQIFPDVHKDNRGSFTEVLKCETPYAQAIDEFEWLKNLNWIKQINRSKTFPGIIRGMHAQTDSSCQAKLVESVCGDIYDIIIDARPDSVTFGKIKIYYLDANIQNKLFVPCGFLHGFLTPMTNPVPAVFNYYCSKPYDKNKEICINPLSIINLLITNLESCSNAITDSDKEHINDILDVIKYSDIKGSEKDFNGMNYTTFMEKTFADFRDNDILWYKDGK